MDDDQRNPFFDFAETDTEIEAREASELRVEMRSVYQAWLDSRRASLAQARAMLPLLKRLRRFRQVSDAEVDHFKWCLAYESERLTRDAAVFVDRWEPTVAHPGARLGVTGTDSPFSGS